MWLLALIMMLTPARDVEAFQRTDRFDLTAETAREQLASARIAGQLYNIPPEMLLAIAWHESRYHADAVTVEPGHRVSCGVMTPTPQRRCSSAELTPFGGYVAGAKHLRMWLDHCNGNTWCALTAYIGGMGLVRVCAHGTWIVRPGVDACDVVHQFRSRAALIRNTLARVQS